MNITLNWENLNDSEDGFAIYRSDTTFDSNNKPQPLATLPARATSYTDSTVELNKLYYYRIGTIKGSEEALSRLIIEATVPNTGPGPSTLATGNWEYGFFGLVSGAQLIDNESLSSAVNFLTGALIPNGDWIKVAYKGKVLFISKYGARKAVSWDSLYTKGLVHGREDGGMFLPTFYVNDVSKQVPQNKRITISGNEFKVRLMTTGNNNYVPGSAGGGNSYLPNEDLSGSEWNDIMYRLVATDYFPTNASTKLASLDNELEPDSANPGSYPSICQEAFLNNKAQVVSRGMFYGGNGITQTNVLFRHTHSVTSGGVPFYGGSQTTILIWRPVLELVI